MAQGSARLYVTDLCRITGVSERTLEYAFKEVMGLAPMAYLARLRLHEFGRRCSPRPTGRPPSPPQLSNGILAFRRIFRAYKECFGELPSETLRRRDTNLQIASLQVNRAAPCC